MSLMTRDVFCANTESSLRVDPFAPDDLSRDDFLGGAVRLWQPKDGYRAGIQRVAKALWECEVPLIAAVNGPAYGAGCDTTCLCDIRIASTRATFAEKLDVLEQFFGLGYGEELLLELLFEDRHLTAGRAGGPGGR